MFMFKNVWQYYVKFLSYDALIVKYIYVTCTKHMMISISKYAHN